VAVQPGSSTTMLLRFPGQWEDGVGGFHQNWWREYGAGVGRYRSADPIGLDGGVNSHLYSLGQPVSRFDNDGQICKKQNNTGARYRLSWVTMCCLKEIFPGSHPEYVEIRENSTRPQCLDDACNDWKDNSIVKLWNGGPLKCGRTVATTLKNRIFLRGAGVDFERDTNLLLHEFTHVFLQWNTGIMKNEKHYSDFVDEWENEADGIASAYEMKFEKCRRDLCSCQNAR
jgi:RHS repeat-associated protein